LRFLRAARSIASRASRCASALHDATPAQQALYRIAAPPPAALQPAIEPRALRGPQQHAHQRARAHREDHGGEQFFRAFVGSRWWRRCSAVS
jgi:hypothetical protein